MVTKPYSPVYVCWITYLTDGLF